jgi:hypothetical protein
MRFHSNAVIAAAAAVVTLSATSHALKGQVPGMPHLGLIDLDKHFAGQQVMDGLIPNVPAGAPGSIQCDPSIFGTNVNGSCHNLRFPSFGLGNMQINTRRGAPRFLGDPQNVGNAPVLAEGSDAQRNLNLPNPREVSNLVVAEGPNFPQNIKGVSRILIMTGQFLDHDFALTLEQPEVGGEEVELEQPAGEDIFVNGLRAVPRSVFRMAPRRSSITFPAPPGQVPSNREFPNVNTPWIDLGQVYGDADAQQFPGPLTDLGFPPNVQQPGLRLFKDGLMRTSVVNGREFPPLNSANMSVCGDIRCEENTQLFSFHTLFLREHQRLARLVAQNFNATAGRFFPQVVELLAINASTDPANLTPEFVANLTRLFDQAVYSYARVLNIWQWQSITWDAYLPYLLGRRTFFELTGNYRGFDEGVDPSAALEFTTAVFRYGHSGVPSQFDFQDQNGQLIQTDNQPAPFFSFNNPLSLSTAFMFSQPIRLGQPRNLPAIFIGQSRIVHARLEQRVTSPLRNTLFARTMPPGFDLISRNMVRGRDHGLQSFNFYRRVYGLPEITCPGAPGECFRQLVAPDLEADGEMLLELYGNIDACDLWVCGMAERSLEDSLLGALFTTIMSDQFNRMRNGDRIWFENYVGTVNFSIPMLRDTFSLRFPARLNDLINNNLLADMPIPNVPFLQNAFVIRPVYLAMNEPGFVQVEWAETDEIRGMVDGWDILVSGPNLRNGGGGATPTIMRSTPLDQRWLLLTPADGITPGATYQFTVSASLATPTGPNGAAGSVGNNVLLNADPLIVANLAAEGGEEGGEGPVAPPQPISGRAIGGIVGGTIGGAVLLGAAFFLVRRRGSVKNDEFTQAFF